MDQSTLSWTIVSTKQEGIAAVDGFAALVDAASRVVGATKRSTVDNNCTMPSSEDLLNRPESFPE